MTQTRRRRQVPHSPTGERQRRIEDEPVPELWDPDRGTHVKGNPAARNHAPTMCCITSANGARVPVMELRTVRMDYDSVRVNPEVARRLLKAEVLWTEQPEYVRLTHALRSLQVISIAFDSPKRREVLGGPGDVLTQLGLPRAEAHWLAEKLRELRLLETRHRQNIGKSVWLVCTDVHAIGHNGHPLNDPEALTAPETREEEPVGEPDIASNEDLFVPPRTPRHKVLPVIHQALLRLVPADAVLEDGYLHFHSRESIYRQVAELLGRKHKALEVDYGRYIRGLGMLRVNATRPQDPNEYWVLAEPMTVTEAQFIRLRKRVDPPSARPQPKPAEAQQPSTTAMDEFMAAVQKRLDDYAAQVSDLEAKLASKDARIGELEAELAASKVVIPEGIAKHLS